jgi:alkyldihydroxyacetonephosphate synthase
MVIARPSDPYPDQSWSGWGDPTQVPVLPEAVLAPLRDGLGVERAAAGPPAGGVMSLTVPPPRINAAVTDELRGVLGAEPVATDRESRIRHALGRSTPDLLRLRADKLGGGPDAVVFPGSHREVLELLELCTARRIAVVPFGGGTSVVGGVEPDAGGFGGVVALDTRRMNALLAVDSESRVAELEPGLRGPEAEALLGAEGFTIGHFPQSFEYATLGGFAATRSSGQSSAGYGRFDELVVSLQVATPAGTLTFGRAPKSAAGPDLRQLILGSEGAFGVITALSVQLRAVPKLRVYEGWRFDSFARGTAAVRRLAQDGPLPTVLRLSDDAETALSLTGPAERGVSAAGCLAIVGHEGAAAEVAARQAQAARVLRECGAGAEPGAGGASLYFTVCCAQRADPVEQWRQAKAAASDAILAAGGSITHHHGVGRDHLDWYEREIGQLGVALLRAVKSELDPAGILNPGILLRGG